MVITAHFVVVMQKINHHHVGVVDILVSTMEDHEGKSYCDKVNASVARGAIEGINGLKKLTKDEEAMISMTKDDVMSMQFATLGDAE